MTILPDSGDTTALYVSTSGIAVSTQTLARFRRERKYSERKQFMRSKNIIKTVQTQMPTARADEADNVNGSGNSNTERDFTSLWAHLKISAGPGIRKETICSFNLMGKSYVFISIFLYSPFSVPLLPSLSIYEF